MPVSKMPATKIEEIRALFPALTTQTYMSICDKMILADPVRQSVDNFLDKLAMASANRTDHEDYVESSRIQFAQMMSVNTEEVAVTRNVSDGVNAIAWAFPFKTGDNIVICADAEHPNNIYPWLRLRERDIDVRIVPAINGRIDIDAMIAAMDQHTRLATVASVSFAPGYRTDTTKLGEYCQKRNIFLLIDGVQSAGILHHDLAQEPVDAFATSTSKGLLGLYGSGFMYINENWLDRLNPAYLSRTGVDLGSDDASAMGEHQYHLYASAKRFEVGSYNLAASYAAEASLNLLNEIGTKAIEAHVLHLARTLREGLAEQGLLVSMPQQNHEESHIITCGELDAGGHGFSHDPRINDIHQTLLNANIIHTLRRGQLRFGLHVYNNMIDIDHVLKTLNHGK
ncbi:aminotransferase class V-fold PLP-dependent enzyme [Paenochrobactrum sp. BZR 588]|uniref:aminotransferase class V-fold PLP-dependent enzyme n=1 Tax=unclassified Paenochrobactrum TaxID=2639760 RepID=UPI00385445EA